MESNRRRTLWGNDSNAWPLSLSQQDAALAILCALFVSMPYGGVDTPVSRAALDDNSITEALAESAPTAIQLLRADSQWAVLEQIAGASQTIPKTRRDLIAVELVLAGDFVPDDAADFDTTLYWRRVDTVLEALGSGFASDQIVALAAEAAALLKEESKSTISALLTSENLLSTLEDVHALQSYATGIYVPFAADGLRWGQRKLDTVGDGELLLAVSTDLVRLQLRAEQNDIEAVRRYGIMLSNDVQAMSTARASGEGVDRRARQIRLFTTLLTLVARLIDEDDDGLAPNAAPHFEEMRLIDARRLAEVMSIELRDIDGLLDADGGKQRSVMAAGNWVVHTQLPAPAAPLGQRRIVRVWILRRGEEHLSVEQQDEVDRRRSLGGP